MQRGNRAKDKDIAAGKEAKWAAKITGKIYKNVLKLLFYWKQNDVILHWTLNKDLSWTVYRR